MLCSQLCLPTDSSDRPLTNLVLPTRESHLTDPNIYLLFLAKSEKPTSLLNSNDIYVVPTRVHQAVTELCKPSVKFTISNRVVLTIQLS